LQNAIYNPQPSSSSSSILFPKRNCSFLANGMFTDLQQAHNKQERILQKMDNQQQQQQLPDTKFTKVLC
jgi:hypothetical protein